MLKVGESGMLDGVPGPGTGRGAFALAGAVREPPLRSSFEGMCRGRIHATLNFFIHCTGRIYAAPTLESRQTRKDFSIGHSPRDARPLEGLLKNPVSEVGGVAVHAAAQSKPNRRAKARWTRSQRLRAAQALQRADIRAAARRLFLY